MKKVQAFWNWVTYQRHRSELAVLRRSKGLYFFAIYPITLNLILWWFLICLPLIIPIVGSYSLLDAMFDYPFVGGVFESVLVAVGLTLFVALHFAAITAVLMAAPWFLHWYFIAFALSFGRKKMAQKKEEYLVNSIAAYEAEAPGSNP